jgi:hypothetical protein
MFWWIHKDCKHKWLGRPSKNQNGLCSVCNHRGFDSTLPSYLYIIKHEFNQSYKIGITNKKSNRLDIWLKKGWHIVKLYEHENGVLINNVETTAVQWIRKD